MYSLACPDWADRLRAGRPPMPDMPLYTERGARAVQALNLLRLADVPGTPTFGEAGGDWFRAIVAVLFGALDPVTKARLIRELFLLVPKKNGKTTDGALMMLVALLLNERPKASFFMTGPVQDVADLAFSAASGAIQLDPVLERKFHVREHVKQIVHRETRATLDIMTFDPAIVTGLKVSGGALIDEVHEVAKMSKAAKALRQLRGGMMPFPEAFLAMITTQSDGEPQGIFRDELTKARDIRDGKREGAMLPVLYEFPMEMQRDPERPWADPRHWGMVTPSLGGALKLERLVEGYREAELTSMEELQAWASQHLNIEMGTAIHGDGWAGAPFWDGCAEPGLTLDALLERSEVVTIGIDGGGLDDLLGLTLIGRERESGRWLWWSRAWAHPIVLDRRKEIAQKLRDLEDAAELAIVKHMGEDDEELAAIVKRVHDEGLLPEKNGVGADQAGIGAILDAMVAAGVPQCTMVGVQQGWRLTGAIGTTERYLAAGKIVHGGQALMRWVVGNAKTRRSGNAVLVDKQTSGSAKIDPLMAGFNAMHLMSMNPSAMAGSHSQGFVSL
jgi:phage terminase large subunit-like protein